MTFSVSKAIDPHLLPPQALGGAADRGLEFSCREGQDSCGKLSLLSAQCLILRNK